MQGQVKVRSIRVKFTDIFNLRKQRHVSDAEYPKDSNGAIYFFSLRGTAFQKVVFYCMTSQLVVALKK